MKQDKGACHLEIRNYEGQLTSVGDGRGEDKGRTRVAMLKKKLLVFRLKEFGALQPVNLRGTPSTIPAILRIPERPVLALLGRTGPRGGTHGSSRTAIGIPKRTSRPGVFPCTSAEY